MAYIADRSTNRNLVVALVVLIIVGYAFFQARKIIIGPQVEFLSPENGSSHDEPLVEIKGKTRNINTISLNDRPIFIDENGYFSQKILLSPGYNIIEVAAKDRFGKATDKSLEIVYTGPEIIGASSTPASLPQATTTAPAATSTAQ